LNALKARVKVRGLAAIDKRTSAARHLPVWRRDLVADLGGEADLTAAQLALVELAVRTRLYIDHVDAWLMAGRKRLISGRRRALYPVVLQRQQLADRLARYLGMLGLERRSRPVAVAHRVSRAEDRRPGRVGG
jgi:hypothetical protein